MSLHSRFARRPSPSMVVASAALFLSLGGVGYAATQIPNNSVGSSQLRNGAVTNHKLDFLSVGTRKIQEGAVGIKRINSGQVQARVRGTCAANTAMAAIDTQGNPQCTPTAPKEFSNSTPAVAITTNSPIQALTLPAGSTYLVSANPQVDVSPTATSSRIEVDCTLFTNPGDASTTQTRSVTFQTGGTDHQTATIPLEITAPAVANGSAATVTCTKTGASGTPTVTVAGSVHAIQTASNN